MASAQGDYGHAHRLFLEAIQLASDIQATPQALDALLGLASVLSQTGETNHAFALLTLVRDHTASTQESKADAERLSAELLPYLSSEIAPPAQEGESDHTIDSLIGGILP
jgi:TolA-binding protein